jgi:hypothetical protein
MRSKLRGGKSSASIDIFKGWTLPDNPADSALCESLSKNGCKISKEVMFAFVFNASVSVCAPVPQPMSRIFFFCAKFGTL